MSYAVPCKDGNHEAQQVFDSGYHRLLCARCPISVSVATTYARNASNVGAILRKAFADAERDWFIKELES